MDPSPPLDADRLLAHAAWVRRLAGQLVRDPDAADDAAQDAFATALRSGPREASRTKAWFAAVVRSFVRRAARSDGRRARREEAAARPERVDSTAEIVARAQASRVVVDAVLALPEPYRSTILMRWFDDLPPARIAELRGEPVETVRTRLKRGHALLREWLSGLQALVVLSKPSPSAAAVTGGLVMTTLGKVVVGAATAAAVTATTWTVWSQEAAPAPKTAEASAASRWDDVTAANWKKLVKEDDGETMKKSIAGLEDETLDLETFFRFLDQRFADSVVVPGTEVVTKSSGKSEVSWVQVYSNEKRERSAVKFEWSKDQHEEHVTLVFEANSWARRRADELGLSPDQLHPTLVVLVVGYSIGNFSCGGMVRITPGPSGATPDEARSLLDRLDRLKRDGRLPSMARWGFKDGKGEHGWSRSDSTLPITVAEMERITSVYDRFSKAAREVADAASK